MKSEFVIEDERSESAIKLAGIGALNVEHSLYYCPSCKLRFQERNFGYGYPKLNSEGVALCPYCGATMAQALGESFPVEWVEERPKVFADSAL
jgi:rubrerythrin